MKYDIWKVNKQTGEAIKLPQPYVIFGNADGDSAVAYANSLNTEQYEHKIQLAG